LVVWERCCILAEELKKYTNMTFTLDTYQRLKVAYNKARQNNLEVFTFDNHDLLTDYAKYLIEYLTPGFEN
jgi:hypothetical protein